MSCPTNNHTLMLNPSQTPTQPSNHSGAQQISPADSARNNPNNAYPTSSRPQHSLPLYVPPHPPGRARQLGPFHSILYVPAALRPPEPPVTNTPMTPPKGVRDYGDSFHDPRAQGHQFGNNTRTPWDPVIKNDCVGDGCHGEVTGGPTRDHWKANTQSSHCDSPKCRVAFSLLVRRHHCRHCGLIFCDKHSSWNIPLNQDARFHPNGVKARVCETCHRHYRQWDDRRIQKKHRDNRHEERSQNDPTVPLAGSSGNGSPISLGLTGEGSVQAAGSAPSDSDGDRAWSTF